MPGERGYVIMRQTGFRRGLGDEMAFCGFSTPQSHVLHLAFGMRLCKGNHSVVCRPNIKTRTPTSCTRL
jgi:hypothetical protein